MKDYLISVGFSIASQDVGGVSPRRIHFFSGTGKVMMRLLKRADDMRIVEEEKQFEKTFDKTHHEGEVELFI